jgi:hypothetical protein
MKNFMASLLPHGAWRRMDELRFECFVKLAHLVSRCTPDYREQIFVVVLAEETDRAD